MARGRFLSKSLSTSRRFEMARQQGGNLGEFCQLLFPLLNSHADDFGRLAGDAFTVKVLVLPTSPRPESDFETALSVLASVGLIARAEVDGQVVIQIPGFEHHQSGLHKRTRSLYPSLAVPGSSGKPAELPETGTNTSIPTFAEGFQKLPGTSRKFPELPSEGKGSEVEVEGKGREGEGKPPARDGDGERLWEMFRTRALALRDATLPLSCRQVEMGSVIDFLTRYPDPSKWAWLIDAYLTSRHRQIVAAPISIGQLCKWAPWLEAQATAPAPESPRMTGNRAAHDAYVATLKGVTKP